VVRQSPHSFKRSCYAAHPACSLSHLLKRQCIIARTRCAAPGRRGSWPGRAWRCRPQSAAAPRASSSCSGTGRPYTADSQLRRCLPRSCWQCMCTLSRPQDIMVSAAPPALPHQMPTADFKPPTYSCSPARQAGWAQLHRSVLGPGNAQAWQQTHGAWQQTAPHVFKAHLATQPATHG